MDQNVSRTARRSPNGTPPGPSRIAVRVTKDALRQIRAGHPWVYDGSITRLKPAAGLTEEQLRPGDLAVVFDERRRFAAIGLYDPTSPIRIRILHRGAPRAIDGEFFSERILEAARPRLEAFDESRTNGYRVVHGENDGLPGLVVDRYSDCVVVKIYTPAWIPHLDHVVQGIREFAKSLPAGLRSVVLRTSRSVDARHLDEAVRPGPSNGPLYGHPVEGPVVFRENGLRFEADVVHGHKTGFFLDQRDNRRMVRGIAAGRDVLDVFSFTGGFSVSAAAGGAARVHSVDVNPLAIGATLRNMSLNDRIRNVRRCEHTVTTGDAYETLAGLVRDHRRYDLVVVDPPAFASRRSQVPGALRAYGELTGLACRLVRHGGQIFQASCSAPVTPIDFQQTVIEAAHEAGRELSAITETGQPLDHPVGFAQGRYLKGILATVTRR